MLSDVLKLNKSSKISNTIFAILICFEIAVGQQINHRYEIKSLSGLPDYRSVNLTWEIEDVANEIGNEGALIKSFVVFYCEMRSWGLHKCKSQTLPPLVDDKERNNHEYSVFINNLRMATKYSFHVKPQFKSKDSKISGRSDLGDSELGDSSLKGQSTIIIPTKGFSAHATLCLPDASEIEVETGPYFGGRIATENGNCAVQGDPNDAKETYSMRIEHEKCGSHVSTTDLTVETFVTVQENLGILTHSTRRFVVVCTFQPDTLTVRARLALPGKGNAAAVETPDFWPANGRNARERQFRMVDKTSLVTRLNDPDRDLGTVEEIDSTENRIERFSDAKYAKLLQDDHLKVTEKQNKKPSNNNFGLTAVVISASLALIMFGTIVFLIQREMKKRRNEEMLRIAIQKN